MIKFIFNEAQKNSFYLSEKGFERKSTKQDEQEIDEEALNIKTFDY